MKQSRNTYIILLVFHLFLGIAVFLIPFLSKLYGILVILFGAFYIIIKNNRNNEALYMASYMIGIEVFLRMTNGTILHETGKYGVILFMVLGIFYNGIKKNGFIYLVFLLLLFPSVLISVEHLSHDIDFRKAIVFNLLGSICLAISALYCYQREITFEQLKNIISFIALPIISLLAYIFLYTPDLKDVITNTSSNFATSGGFGPNQVSTILGLGMFVYFFQIILNSPNKRLLILHTLIFAICSYRGILTFSRGGVYVGIIMIIILTYMLYKQLNVKGKSKIIMILVGGIVLGFSVWTYSSLQTEGMIDKRYTNKDALGREKDDLLTGREELIETELEMFFGNPLFGVGVGRNKEVRLENTGHESASHNEVTRLLAEHGMFGLLALFILIVVPLSLYPTNKQHLLLLCFFVFWALTINHAAMRLAAPAFIYALSLLKVTFDENPSIHRE